MLESPDLDIITQRENSRNGTLSHSGRDVSLELDLTGSMLCGYEVISLLAEAKTSNVYVAKDTSVDNRVVVLKVNSVRKYHDQEYHTLAHLDHASLPSLLNTFSTNIGKRNFHVNVFSFSSTHNLHTYIESCYIPVMRMREFVVNCLEQIAHALDYLHGKGVIHCDVKPQNIIVSHDGRAVLIDFDSARHAASDSPLRSTDKFIPRYFIDDHPDVALAQATTEIDHYGLIQTLFASLNAIQSSDPLDKNAIQFIFENKAAYPKMWKLLSESKEIESFSEDHKEKKVRGNDFSKKNLVFAIAFPLAVAFFCWKSFVGGNLILHDASPNKTFPPATVDVEIANNSNFMDILKEAYRLKDFAQVNALCSERFEHGRDPSDEALRLWFYANMELLMSKSSEYDSYPSILVANRNSFQDPTVKFDLEYCKLLKDLNVNNISAEEFETASQELSDKHRIDKRLLRYRHNGSQTLKSPRLKTNRR